MIDINKIRDAEMATVEAYIKEYLLFTGRKIEDTTLCYERYTTKDLTMGMRYWLEPKKDITSKGGQSTKGFYATALRLCAALRSFWRRG